MADIIFIVLLALHIGSIVGWMGGAVLFISVVAPSIRRMSLPSRAEFIISTVPAYVRFIIGTSITGIVAGVLLFWYATTVIPSLAPTSSGMTLIQAGTVLGLLALLLAFGLVLPTSSKLVSNAKQMKSTNNPPQSSGENQIGQQMTKLQKILSMGSGIVTVLLALALILMIIGTNI